MKQHRNNHIRWYWLYKESSRLRYFLQSPVKTLYNTFIDKALFTPAGLILMTSSQEITNYERTVCLRDAMVDI